MMSVSLQARPVDLYTAASNTSLLPIDMKTPVPSTETRGGRDIGFSDFVHRPVVGLHGYGECLS
jgi:hypothetical protein